MQGANDPLDDPDNDWMWDRMSRLLGRAMDGEELSRASEEALTRFIKRVEAWEEKRAQHQAGERE